MIRPVFTLPAVALALGLLISSPAGSQTAPCPPGCDPSLCAGLQQASISGASAEIGTLNPPAFWAPPPIRELSCLDELFGLGLNILSGPFDLNILSLIKRLVCGAVQSKLYQATSYVNGQLATAGGYVSPTLLGQSILPAPQVYLGTGNSSLGQVNMTGSILSTPTQQNILDRYCDPGMGGCPAKTTTLDNLFK